MKTDAVGRVFEDGQVVVKQGESGDCMFAIQEGRLDVFKTGRRGEVKVAQLEAGDIFGEMAIFDREERSATVKAAGRARVLTVDKRTFLRRVQEDPTLAFNLVRMMSRRIRSLSGHMAQERDRRHRGDRRRNDRRRSDRRQTERRHGDRRVEATA